MNVHLVDFLRKSANGNRAELLRKCIRDEGSKEIRDWIND